MEDDFLAGRYRLGRQLGAGSMGRVFLAIDPRTQGRVAVKLLLPAYAQDYVARARFEREATLMSRLDSPFIVHLLDAGIEGRRPFIVMEYVPGPTLAGALKEQERFEVPQALSVLLQILLALDAADARGIQHRDLKPANIKLYEGHTKVMDLGLGRAGDNLTLTATGTYLGTPAYSAPERAEGRGDIRSDLYSAGLILYTLLAGAPPFVGANVWTVLHDHKTRPLPPLPYAAPEIVTALLARSLEKAPEDRFQTPADFAQAAISAGAVLPAAPYAPPADTEPFVSLQQQVLTPFASDDETLGDDPDYRWTLQMAPEPPRPS